MLKTVGVQVFGISGKCQIIPERYSYAQTIRILFASGLTLQLHLKSINDSQKALKYNINTFWK
jgi:hypothetical protein